MNSEPERTEIVETEGRTLSSVLSFFSRARTRLDLSASYLGPRTGEEFVDALRAANNRGVRTRMVTEVTKENLATMRAASAYIQIRHVAGLKGNSWAVTDDEYVSSLAAGEFKTDLPLILSNARTLVVEHQSIFDALWGRGEPLAERADALESGKDLPEVEIIREPDRIETMYLSLARGAAKQILLLLPTPAAFLRDAEIGMIRVLELNASKGVRVRLLTPVDQAVLEKLPRLQSEGSGGISLRSIPSAETKETVTLLVVDNLASLTIEEKAPTELQFGKAVETALLATGEPRVRQSTRLFERLWQESELQESERIAREREEISRMRAELMQDILTHDIRNFNQVARLNAELLGEVLTDSESTKRVSAILRAIDGSSKLIDRAKKLGSILAAGDVDLHPTSLRASFDRSMSLVKKGNTNVKIRVESKLSGRVLADDLLDEVFVNVLSNAVRYTPGEKVSIEVTQESEELTLDAGTGPMAFWKVSVADHGRGIADAQKPSVFKRYLATASGSGLGLSVVHALVTDRYSGKVGVKNRVENDFTKGTTVEIWLPKG